jgi:hypothetical protein
MDAAVLQPLVLLSSSIASMILVHPILQRVLRRISRQLVAILACVGGSVPLVIAAALKASAAQIYDTLVFACVAYAYFHVFNMSETARRIRILLEVDQRGGIEAAELHRAYSEAEVIDKRLKRMVEMGSLERHGDRYVIRGRVLYFAARVLDVWRGLLGYHRTTR